MMDDYRRMRRRCERLEALLFEAASFLVPSQHDPSMLTFSQRVDLQRRILEATTASNTVDGITDYHSGLMRRLGDS